MATRTDRRDRAGADRGRPVPDTAPDGEVGVTDLQSGHFLSILKRAVKEAVNDEIPDSAAAIAYYSFLAIPALLLVSVGVFSLVASPSAIETLIEKLGTVIPAEAATLLENSLAHGRGTPAPRCDDVGGDRRRRRVHRCPASRARRAPGTAPRLRERAARPPRAVERVRVRRAAGARPALVDATGTQHHRAARP